MRALGFLSKNGSGPQFSPRAVLSRRHGLVSEGPIPMLKRLTATQTGLYARSSQEPFGQVLRVSVPGPRMSRTIFRAAKGPWPEADGDRRPDNLGAASIRGLIRAGFQTGQPSTVISALPRPNDASTQVRRLYTTPQSAGTRTWDNEAGPLLGPVDGLGWFHVLRPAPESSDSRKCERRGRRSPKFQSVI